MVTRGRKKKPDVREAFIKVAVRRGGELGEGNV